MDRDEHLMLDAGKGSCLPVCKQYYGNDVISDHLESMSNSIKNQVADLMLLRNNLSTVAPRLLWGIVLDVLCILALFTDKKKAFEFIPFKNDFMFSLAYCVYNNSKNLLKKRIEKMFSMYNQKEYDEETNYEMKNMELMKYITQLISMMEKLKEFFLYDDDDKNKNSRRHFTSNYLLTLIGIAETTDAIYKSYCDNFILNKKKLHDSKNIDDTVTIASSPKSDYTEEKLNKINVNDKILPTIFPSITPKSPLVSLPKNSMSYNQSLSPNYFLNRGLNDIYELKQKTPTGYNINENHLEKSDYVTPKNFLMKASNSPDYHEIHIKDENTNNSEYNTHVHTNTTINTDDKLFIMNESNIGESFCSGSLSGGDVLYCSEESDAIKYKKLSTDRLSSIDNVFDEASQPLLPPKNNDYSPSKSQNMRLNYRNSNMSKNNSLCSWDKLIKNKNDKFNSLCQQESSNISCQVKKRSMQNNNSNSLKRCMSSFKTALLSKKTTIKYTKPDVGLKSINKFNTASSFHNDRSYSGAEETSNEERLDIIGLFVPDSVTAHNQEINRRSNGLISSSILDMSSRIIKRLMLSSITGKVVDVEQKKYDAQSDSKFSNSFKALDNQLPFFTLNYNANIDAQYLASWYSSTCWCNYKSSLNNLDTNILCAQSVSTNYFILPSFKDTCQNHDSHLICKKKHLSEYTNVAKNTILMYEIMAYRRFPKMLKSTSLSFIKNNLLFRSKSNCTYDSLKHSNGLNGIDLTCPRSSMLLNYTTYSKRSVDSEVPFLVNRSISERGLFYNNSSLISPSMTQRTSHIYKRTPDFSYRFPCLSDKVVIVQTYWRVLMANEEVEIALKLKLISWSIAEAEAIYLNNLADFYKNIALPRFGTDAFNNDTSGIVAQYSIAHLDEIMNKSISLLQSLVSQLDKWNIKSDISGILLHFTYTLFPCIQFATIYTWAIYEWNKCLANTNSTNAKKVYNVETSTIPKKCDINTRNNYSDTALTTSFLHRLDSYKKRKNSSSELQIPEVFSSPKKRISDYISTLKQINLIKKTQSSVLALEKFEKAQSVIDFLSKKFQCTTLLIQHLPQSIVKKYPNPMLLSEIYNAKLIPNTDDSSFCPDSTSLLLLNEEGTISSTFDFKNISNLECNPHLEPRDCLVVLFSKAILLFEMKKGMFCQSEIISEDTLQESNARNLILIKYIEFNKIVEIVHSEVTQKAPLNGNKYYLFSITHLSLCGYKSKTHLAFIKGHSNTRKFYTFLIRNFPSIITENKEIKFSSEKTLNDEI